MALTVLYVPNSLDSGKRVNGLGGEPLKVWG